MNPRPILYLLLVLVCCFANEIIADSNDVVTLRQRILVQRNDANAVKNSVDFRSEQRSMQKWKSAPKYQVLSFAVQLCTLLNSRESVTTAPYHWSPNSHDMNLIAGRAAWVLDGLLGIALPPINSTTTTSTWNE